MKPPSHEYARTSFRKPEPLLRGIDAGVHSLIGRVQRRASVLDQLRIDAEKIDALHKTVGDLTDGALAKQLLDHRAIFRRGGRAAEHAVVPALAAIREAAYRTMGMRPFVVQLMGALGLHRGYLIEMATGEGKTLTAGLAAVLAGWSHQPCHIITVNDYLVQRDTEWLTPLYHMCGVRVGFVVGEMPPEKRRHAYDCDVTYTTSKEVVADFLRDSLQIGVLRDPTRRLIRRLLNNNTNRPENLVLRGLHTAIVDEADSVLIDEAVTPLIISTPRKNEALRNVVTVAQEIVSNLKPNTDYSVNVRYREIEITESGHEKIGSGCSALPGIWQGSFRRNELIKQALIAREFYLRDKQYVIDDGKIMIVDESTGRRMPQRTWRQGIHQAVEAKEGIEVTDPTEVVARLSFQRFFRFYTRLSGMTGTAREASDEFWSIYKLPVVAIPPNRPCVRKHLPDQVFASANEKWSAIVAEIERVHATRQPILVGTRNVAASEELARQLRTRNLEVTVLNAIRHQDEAVIVAAAGHAGRITIATNMAGRGTDIRLDKGVHELGGLRVIATERHDSGRVDRQLFGRSARQGEPGAAQSFISLEDELFQRFLPAPIRNKVQQAVKSNLPAARALANGALRLAQHTAQRSAYKQRASVLRLDDWMQEALSFAGSEI
jgi:preprotein translocase subunit SecA